MHLKRGMILVLLCPVILKLYLKILKNLILPVVNEKADYAKGNRLNYYDVQNIMPKHRFFGNTLLTLLTKFASGYYHIMDPQMGYTALNLKDFAKIRNF